MGSKHLDHLGERSCLDLSGEGDRKALVGDVAGDPATVVARWKGGGTDLRGVSDGDATAEESSFDLLSEAERAGSSPSPSAALRAGVLSPDDAGEPRLPVLPGTIGNAALTSAIGVAAIPSHSISSIGCTTRVMSAGPNSEIWDAMMAWSRSIIAEATSAALAGLIGANGWACRISRVPRQQARLAFDRSVQSLLESSLAEQYLIHSSVIWLNALTSHPTSPDIPSTSAPFFVNAFKAPTITFVCSRLVELSELAVVMILYKDLVVINSILWSVLE
jgi:hypothetical protein